MAITVIISIMAAIVIIITIVIAAVALVVLVVVVVVVVLIMIMMEVAVLVGGVLTRRRRLIRVTRVRATEVEAGWTENLKSKLSSGCQVIYSKSKTKTYNDYILSHLMRAL